MERTVIIGLGSAGYAALMAIKKSDPRCDITIVDGKDYDLMHPCGMPYAVEGIVDPQQLSQNIHLDKMNVEKIKGSISKINTEKKEVSYISNNDEYSLDYRRLILATGSEALFPPIKGLSNVINKGLYTLTSMADCRNLIDNMPQTSHALIIGAGAIGLETAFAIKQHVSQVTVLEMQNQVLPGVLDQDFAKICEAYLVEQGIDVKKNFTVEEILGTDTFSGVKSGNTVLSGELGVLAAGFKANYSFAEKSGIDCNSNGIVVNNSLETSSAGIYAAGDCISGWSIIDNKPVAAKLATSAYKQGTIAGINSQGGEATYKGTAGTFVTRIGELEIAGTGYTVTRAKELGYDPVSGKITSGILPEYFPNNENISVKVIFDKKTGRILGAQSVGRGGAAARINIISMAIEFEISIDELTRLEMAYCPAVSEVYDPLLRAIDFGLRRKK